MGVFVFYGVLFDFNLGNNEMTNTIDENWMDSRDRISDFEDFSPEMCKDLVFDLKCKWNTTKIRKSSASYSEEK